MRKKIVAGNWKMNLNKLDAVELFKSLESSVSVYTSVRCNIKKNSTTIKKND